MRKYELLLILPGTLDALEAEASSQKVLNLVKENSQQAQIAAIGKNRLAYPIRQIRYGYFYTLVFETESQNLKVIQEKLVLMRDLLRAIITHFNIQLSPGQKIAYSSEEMLAPATAIKKEESLEEKIHKISRVAAPAQPVPASKVDLADIDKKLDAILSGENLIPGV